MPQIYALELLANVVDGYEFSREAAANAGRILAQVKLEENEAWDQWSERSLGFTKEFPGCGELKRVAGRATRSRIQAESELHVALAEEQRAMRALAESALQAVQETRERIAARTELEKKEARRKEQETPRDKLLKSLTQEEFDALLRPTAQEILDNLAHGRTTIEEAIRNVRAHRRTP